MEKAMAKSSTRETGQRARARIIGQAFSSRTSPLGG